MIVAIIHKNMSQKSSILIIYKTEKIVYNTYALHGGLKRQADDAYSECRSARLIVDGISAAMRTAFTGKGRTGMSGSFVIAANLGNTLEII